MDNNEACFSFSSPCFIRAVLEHKLCCQDLIILLLSVEQVTQGYVMSCSVLPRRSVNISPVPQQKPV